jgi:hypothetical protein
MIMIAQTLIRITSATFAVVLWEHTLLQVQQLTIAHTAASPQAIA